MIFTLVMVYLFFFVFFQIFILHEGDLNFVFILEDEKLIYYAIYL